MYSKMTILSFTHVIANMTFFCRTFFKVKKNIYVYVFFIIIMGENQYNESQWAQMSFCILLPFIVWTKTNEILKNIIFNGFIFGF